MRERRNSPIFWPPPPRHGQMFFSTCLILFDNIIFLQLLAQDKGHCGHWTPHPHRATRTLSPPSLPMKHKLRAWKQLSAPRLPGGGHKEMAWVWGCPCEIWMPWPSPGSCREETWARVCVGVWYWRDPPPLLPLSASSALMEYPSSLRALTSPLLTAAIAAGDAQLAKDSSERADKELRRWL